MTDNYTENCTALREMVYHMQCHLSNVKSELVVKSYGEGEELVTMLRGLTNALQTLEYKLARKLGA